MRASLPGFLAAFGLVVGMGPQGGVRGQDAPPATLSEPPRADAPAEPAPVPKGVEVMARGPVHEAFATPTTEPAPTLRVPKEPPKPINEMPPEQKPEGNSLWIGGYWAWDDERKDFLWVSGIWRTPPPGKQWVAGYWRADGDQWQWVPGFWSVAAQQQAEASQVTYLPAPPAAPATAPPGEPPAADSFYVPGAYVWTGETYGWRAGYWARVQPGYVWVSAHYRWTPSGYVYIPGYWDYALADRGVLYAPVVVDPVVVGPTFVYTPAYVVRDTVVIDALFVRPCCCHYYFGDYYGPVYREYGFESCVIYSRRHYDGIVVYSCWEHRAEPRWASVQVDICLARHEGRAPLPPRTLVQQNHITNITNVTNVTNVTNINKNVYNAPVLAPASQLAQTKGIRTVALDQTARTQARQQSQAIQQVAVQRQQTEIAAPGGAPARPRVATLKMPSTPTVPGPGTGAAANHFSSGPGGSSNPAVRSPGGANVVQPSNPAVRSAAGAATSPVAPNGQHSLGQPISPRPGAGFQPRQPARPGPGTMQKPPPRPQPRPDAQHKPPGGQN